MEQPIIQATILPIQQVTTATSQTMEACIIIPPTIAPDILIIPPTPPGARILQAIVLLIRIQLTLDLISPTTLGPGAHQTLQAMVLFIRM